MITIIIIIVIIEIIIIVMIIIFSHIVRETESNMVPFMQRRGLETLEEKAREVQKLVSSPYLVSKHHDAVVCFSSDGSANTLRDQRSK